MDPSDAAAGILYTHPAAHIVRFNPPFSTIRAASSPFSSDLDYPVDTVETLPWRSINETTVASGLLVIEKIRGSSAFLKSGPFMHAIMRNSQCWCVDGMCKFVLRYGRFQYYRIEFPVTSDEDKAKVEEFKNVVTKILKYEVTHCPFKRGFHVDLPDSAITPRRKGKWKRRESTFLSTPPSSYPGSSKSTSSWTPSPRSATLSNQEACDVNVGEDSFDKGEVSARPGTAHCEGSPETTLTGEPDLSQRQNSRGLDPQAVGKESVSQRSLNPSGELRPADNPHSQQTFSSVSSVGKEDGSETSEVQGVGLVAVISNQEKDIRRSSSELAAQGFLEPATSVTSDSDIQSTPDPKVEAISTVDGQDNPTLEQVIEPMPDEEDNHNTLEQSQVEVLEKFSPRIQSVRGHGAEQPAPKDHDVLPLDNMSDASADSFHSLSTASSREASQVQSTSYPDEPDRGPPYPAVDNANLYAASTSNHKRELSELTITASTIDADAEPHLVLSSSERPSTSTSDRPSTPTLADASVSDSSWPDVATPSSSNADHRLRQRVKPPRSLSPLSPASTVFAPSSPQSQGNHMTAALLQKACAIALGKPIEMVVMLVHILARIAGGATVNDLMSGELFRGPKQDRNHQRDHNPSDHERSMDGWDEDDFGIPLRGRSKSMGLRDTEDESMLDLD